MTISALVDWWLNVHSLQMAISGFVAAKFQIATIVYDDSLTLCSCLCLMKNLVKIDQRLSIYFAAVTFLHVACKTTRNSLTEELVDVLALSLIHI